MYIYNKDLVVPEGYKKMVLKLDAGINGTDDCRAYLVPINTPVKELEDHAWACAVDHASTYGMYNLGDYLHISDEELAAEGIDLEDDCYTEDIYGEFVDYDSNVHDGHLIFGANSDFQWDMY